MGMLEVWGEYFFVGDGDSGVGFDVFCGEAFWLGWEARYGEMGEEESIACERRK